MKLVKGKGVWCEACEGQRVWCEACEGQRVCVKLVKDKGCV